MAAQRLTENTAHITNAKTCIHGSIQKGQPEDGDFLTTDGTCTFSQL